MNKIKVNILVYFTLNILIILCLLLQVINNNWSNVFLCILTLILFLIPSFLTKKLNIIVPTTLEIIVYIFIFSAEILGEVQNYFGIFNHWDTILHTINGFICAAIGLSLINILNKNNVLHISVTPIFSFLFAISFSMLVGIIWEFIEFSTDYYLNKDMQKDQIITKITSTKLNNSLKAKKLSIDNINKTIIYTNNNIIIINNGYLYIGLIDTMKDLFVNFLGAIIFSILGYLCIKNKGNYKLINSFILKLKKG